MTNTRVPRKPVHPGHYLRFAVLSLMLFHLPACSPPVPPERDLLIATASVGGTFYPVGVAMATLITQQQQDEPGRILASAISSSGSAENIRMLELDEAQLAIVQSLFASMAWQGEGLYSGRPVTSLRGICMLWRNVEQIVLRRVDEDNAAENVGAAFARRQGMALSLGPRWSGTEVSAKSILGALGMDADQQFRVAHLGYGPSADALQNRRIDGMFLAAGVPTAAVSQAFAVLGANNVLLVEFSDEELARLRSHYPVWSRYVLAAGTYPGQDRDLQLIAQPNVLITAQSADEEVIYEVTRTLWQNLEFLRNQHRAVHEMSLEHAFTDLPVPLHPGALRFYREQGMHIPDVLIPPESRTPNQP